MSVISCAAIGLVPALHASRANLSDALNDSARGIPGGTRGARFRSGLVVVEVALSVLLLIGSSLLLVSFLKLQSTPPGYDPRGVAASAVGIRAARYPTPAQQLAFIDQVVARVRARPEVRQAAASTGLPTGILVSPPAAYAVKGQPVPTLDKRPTAFQVIVSENYFRTLGIRIVRGRPFRPDDRKGTLDVAIVSEDVAARTWPGEDPIGKRLKWGAPTSNDPWLTVVGIATGTRYQELTVAKPTIYVPAVQFVVAAQRLLVRSSAGTSQVATLVREQVERIDPTVRVMRISPFEAMFDGPLAYPRFNAFLLGVFACVALLLTSIGHYAVTTAHVRQREREIAIRMALGATAWTVRGFVILDVIWVSAAGAAIGFGGAVAAARLLRGMLFGVEGLDPMTLGGVAMMLVAASILSTWTSLRRATRIDTSTLLRSQH